MTRWYYAWNKQKKGPINDAELRALIGSGRIGPTDMVLQEGTQKWVAAGTVSEFSGAVPSSAGSEHSSTGRFRVLSTLRSFGKWLVLEGREIALATFNQTSRLIGFGRAIWRSRALNKAARNADLALGQRLYDTGLGNKEIRDRIAALSLDDGSPGPSARPDGALKAQRADLFLQLAASALTQGAPQAGTEVEYAKARGAHAAVQEQQDEILAAKLKLWPSGLAGWRKVGIGFATGICLTALVLTTIFNSPNDATSQPQLERALSNRPPGQDSPKAAPLASSNEPPIATEKKADHQANDTHDSQARSIIHTMTLIAEILENVKDKQTSEDSRIKLSALMNGLRERLGKGPKLPKEYHVAANKVLERWEVQGVRLQTVAGGLELLKELGAMMEGFGESNTTTTKTGENGFESPENTPRLSILRTFPERFNGKHFYFQKIWLSGKIQKQWGAFLIGSYDEKDEPIPDSFNADGITFQLHPDLAEQLLDNQDIRSQNRYRAHIRCTVYKASVLQGTQEYWAAFVWQIEYLNKNDQVFYTVRVRQTSTGLKAGSKTPTPQASRAWEQAGAKSGWMYVRNNSVGFLIFSATEPTSGIAAIPAYEFSGRVNRKGIFSSLSPPDSAWGLSLFATDISDEGLREFAHFKRLQFLNLDGAGITNAGLRELATLKQLNALVLDGSKVTDEGMRDLTALTALQFLSVMQTDITDSGLQGLAGLRQLQSLRLCYTKITDAGLKDLAVLKELKSLDLSITAVSDVGLKEVVALKGLRNLYLGSTKVSDTGLKHLAALKELENLDLGGTTVSDAGLKEMAALKRLRGVYLSGAKVSDAGLKDLAALKEVTSLCLNGTTVSDAGLKEMVALKGLRELYLDDTKVSDAAVTELAELKELRTLSLFGTKVTPQGVRKLRELLPACDVRADLGTVPCLSLLPICSVP